MTYGFVPAYITEALPKYAKSNPTGFILNIDQTSSIGRVYKISHVKVKMKSKCLFF